MLKLFSGEVSLQNLFYKHDLSVLVNKSHRGSITSAFAS